MLVKQLMEKEGQGSWRHYQDHSDPQSASSVGQRWCRIQDTPSHNLNSKVVTLKNAFPNSQPCYFLPGFHWQFLSYLRP